MKQRRTLSRRVAVFLAGVFVAVCLLLISFVITLKVPTSKTEYAFREGAEQEDFDDESFERNGKWYGLCAKNSIRSVDDFRTTVSKDQVLKTHYADFKWENAKMEKLDKAMLAYVYFRKGDKIFVKKKPIKLPDGDEYITDGNRRVRTHCCNNYTASPPLYESSDLQSELSAGPSFSWSPDLLAELSRGLPFYWSPDLLVDPSIGLLALKSPEQTSPLSPSFVQGPPTPPPVENVPIPLEDTPPINFTPPEYGEGETPIFPQPYPPPTPIIPGNGGGGGGSSRGGGGGDGGGGGETRPIPEAATILLVAIGVAVSFIVFFIVNYSHRKGKNPRT